MEVTSVSVIQWAAVLAVLAWVVYKLGTWRYSEFIQRKMIFVPPTFLVGNMGPFLWGSKSFPDNTRDIYQEYKGHRAVGLFFMNNPQVLVMDPEIIKLVTVKDFDHFTDHVPFVREEDDLLLGRFLFSLKGGRWKAMRHTLTPAFTSSKMKGMFLLVKKCGEQLAEFLEDKCKAENDGALTMSMEDLFSKYTNDVIATSAYGIHCDSLRQPDNEFYVRGKEATNFGGIKAMYFMLYAIIPDIMKALGLRLTEKRVEQFFCSIVSDTMRVREKENIVRPDMIQLLMEARKGTLKADPCDDVQETKAKQPLDLSDEDIASQAFLFFLAGFDTSSTLLSFLAYSIAVHPEIQERVQQEIDGILAEGDGLTYDSLQRMKYLDNVMSETLRLWPPVTDVDRYCVKDYTVAATETQPAVVFKKGDAVAMSAYGIHRNPEYFSEPDRFDPDRFNDHNKHNVKPFTYFPFGSGPRACIGLRFAQMEVKIAMVCLLSRFNLQVTSKTQIPIKLQKGTFNTKAEGGIWLGIKPRH